MTWNSQGLMRTPKQQGAGFSEISDTPYAIPCVYSPSYGWVSTGYGYSTSETYYRVNGKICDAQIVIPSTTTWLNISGGGEWRLLCSGFPAPKNLGAYRIVGSGMHLTYAMGGFDCLMEHVPGEYAPFMMLRFMVMHHGFLPIITETNKNMYFKPFYGEYGLITVKLSYEVA